MTQSYQWITDGDAIKIEIIGNNGIGLPRGTDILPDLKGKVGVITNNGKGHLTEISVYKTSN